MSPHIHSCSPPPPPAGSFGSLPPYLSHQGLFLKRGRVVAGVRKQEVCPNPRLDSVHPSSWKFWEQACPSWTFSGVQSVLQLAARTAGRGGDLPLGPILILFLEKALQESWEVSQLEMGTICHPSALWHTLPCGKVGRHGKMVPSSTQPISLETIFT